MTKSYWLVFGTGGDTKPHGAKFLETDETSARKGAEALRYNIRHATTDDDIKLAEELPSGNPFAPGATFAPVIKQELYDKLVAATATPPTDQAPVSKTGQTSAEKAEKPSISDKPEEAQAAAMSQPASTAPTEDLWSAIKLDSMVLATAPGVEGYWPCKVVAITPKGNMLTLKWHGEEWASEPSFMSPRSKVGLIKPEAI